MTTVILAIELFDTPSLTSVFLCRDVSVVISLLNQKGGVGKTTLAVDLAANLTRRGARALLIDADSQGSALDWAAARDDAPLFSVVGLPRPSLHKEIGAIGQDYEYVLIDGPPRVADVTRSAILAADLVRVPIQPSPYDIWAAHEVVELIEEAKVYKDALKAGFVVNRRIANTVIGRDAREALATYELSTLNATITQRVVFAEAAAAGRSVFEMYPGGPGAAEIDLLIDEAIELLQ